MEGEERERGEGREGREGEGRKKRGREGKGGRVKDGRGGEGERQEERSEERERGKRRGKIIPLVQCHVQAQCCVLPVRMAWSTFSVVERIWVTLMSAGILSPTGRGEGGEGSV